MARLRKPAGGGRKPSKKPAGGGGKAAKTSKSAK